MEYYLDIFIKNGFVAALLVTGIIMYVSSLASEKLTRKKIPGSAIAIIAGLVLAYAGGVITGGDHGVADVAGLSGFAILEIGRAHV